VYAELYVYVMKIMGTLWWWVFPLNLVVVVMTVAVVNNLEALVIIFCC